MPRSFVARHALPGLLGTALIAIGALGVGWLPPTSDFIDAPLVSTLRGSMAGSLASRALVIIGLAMLLQAWLVLGYELASRSGARAPASTKQVVAVLVAWSAPLVIAPPLFSRDVYSYYVQGRVFGDGYDPTTTGISVIDGWFDDGADPMWVESPTPYGPLFLAIERSVAGLASPNGYLAAIAFRLVAVAGVVLLACFVPRLARQHGIDPGRALWLGVLNPVILMHFISGAHNDALMVGLVVAGLALATEPRGGYLAGAALVALGAAVKPIALLALPFVGLLGAGRAAGWWARIRAWTASAAVAVGALAVVYAVVQAGSGVLRATFSTPSGVLTWLSPSTAIGKPLGSLTTWLGWTDDGAGVLTAVRLIALSAALVIVAVLVLRPGGRSPVRGAALAFGTIVILGPVVQPWYLLWFLPLFAVTGLSVRELRVAVVLTAAFTVHGMIESSTNADNLTDISDSITFIVAIGIVALMLLVSPSERRLVRGPRTMPALLPADGPAAEHGQAMRWPLHAREVT